MVHCLQQYRDGGSHPPTLTLDQDGASQPLAELFLAHLLVLSRDSYAVAFGPSTFSQNHLGPLPELFGFEKWSKQRQIVCWLTFKMRKRFPARK